MSSGRKPVTGVIVCEEERELGFAGKSAGADRRRELRQTSSPRSGVLKRRHENDEVFTIKIGDSRRKARLLPTTSVQSRMAIR
jgi:hypothetical protein